VAACTFFFMSVTPVRQYWSRLTGGSNNTTSIGLHIGVSVWGPIVGLFFLLTILYSLLNSNRNSNIMLGSVLYFYSFSQQLHASTVYSVQKLTIFKFNYRFGSQQLSRFSKLFQIQHFGKWYLWHGTTWSGDLEWFYKVTHVFAIFSVFSGVTVSVVVPR